MELTRANERQLLPSCRDLIREVDERQKQGVYENAPQIPPVLLLPIKENQPLREPLRTISNVEDQLDSGVIPRHTSNNATEYTVSRPGAYFSASEIYDAPNFKIHANVSFAQGDSDVDTSETSGTSFELNTSSSDWYNNSQSSISSPPSSFSSNYSDHSKGREDQSVECGPTCLWALQKTLLEQYSSCNFSAFGSRCPAPTTQSFFRQSSSSSSTSTSAQPSAPKLVGNVYTKAPHSPASGKRHFSMGIRNPIVEFHTPSACGNTKGVAVTDILTFEGQCIIDPGTSVASKLTNGDSQKTSIDLIIEWKGHSREVIPIPVRCDCGHEIKKGQIALEIARAHSKYFATQRCDDAYRRSTDIITGVEDLRLMALHTTDNGVTWRAQHAVVENFTYETMEYQTRDGQHRTSTVAYSGRGPTKKFLAWVRDRVEV